MFCWAANLSRIVFEICSICLNLPGFYGCFVIGLRTGSSRFVSFLERASPGFLRKMLANVYAQVAHIRFEQLLSFTLGYAGSPQLLDNAFFHCFRGAVQLAADGRLVH